MELKVIVAEGSLAEHRLVPETILNEVQAMLARLNVQATLTLVEEEPEPIELVLPSADAVTVTVQSVVCPNCNAEQEGWVVDPRGRDHECDECGQKYHVPANVDVKVF